jgi:hypothetical protein
MVTPSKARGTREPTTEEIRSWAIYVPDTGVGMHVSESDAATFDAWLAAHDCEVRATALEEAAVGVLSLGTWTGSVAVGRKAASWLGQRAAALREAS